MTNQRGTDKDPLVIYKTPLHQSEPPSKALLLLNGQSSLVLVPHFIGRNLLRLHQLFIID